jgi:DNA-binding transcriptional LysR family regulator
MDHIPQGLLKERMPEPYIGSGSANHLPHGHISLKEWNTLLAVVRNNSYARAAEVLHISQPAISYTIAKIEERLGISILCPDGRRTRITDIGLQLLAHVEPLVEQAAQVEAIAKQLRAKWRPEIRLAVVEDFPTQLLISPLRSYSDNPSGATVLLTEGTIETVHQLLHKREAELAITRQLPPGMEGDVLVEIEYVLVAHAAHPLFELGRTLSDADLRQAVEVSYEGRNAIPACGADSRQSALKRWNVSSLDTVERALAEGIGYGWLPRHQVQASLSTGRLAVLPVTIDQHRTSRFYLAYPASKTLSDDVNRLTSSLRAAIGGTSLTR